MCSGAGSGAAGSAGAGGAVDAGCLDPMLDRLLAVEVAGLPDSALAADLVGLRVAVSRLESEFARRLVVFDRRGAAGVTGAVSTAAWLRRAVLADLRAHADPAGAQAAEAAAALAHDRRHLSISATFAGAVVLDGVLDPEGGATVLAALMPLAAPGGADDDRTPAQRRADALVELARRALDSAELPTTAGERPHLQIRVDLATLLAGTGTATLDWAGPQRRPGG